MFFATQSSPTPDPRRHLAGLSLLALGWACAIGVATARADDSSDDNLAPPTPAASPRPAAAGASTKLIPLPIYATLPNEGSTFGLMPVVLVVDPKTEQTQSIYAPSASWNAVIGTTGTFRWFHYPSLTQNLTLTASVSARYNYGTLLVWEDRPYDPGAWSNEFMFRVQRSVFFRFFGLGPDSLSTQETSNTRLRGDLSLRRGFNVTRDFNIGVKIEAQRDLVQKDAAPGYQTSDSVFPGTPGMAGASVLGEYLDVRYDSRDNLDYSKAGIFSELLVGPQQGVAGSPSFARVEFQTRVLVPEIPERLQGGFRVFHGYVSSPDVPFYYQESLGGSYLLRGFTEDRFIDQGAWEVEMEQRITLFQTHIYGVTTDWRMDPFISVGQVYHDASGFFSHPRVTEGLGFRAFVRPNVLGRVDVATGGEGPKFYVELGYPF